MVPPDKRLKLFFPDRGYFSSYRNELDLPVEGINLLVCHSLGLHLLPETLFTKCQVLVLIGCFQAFHAETELDVSISRKYVRSMLQELDDRPRRVLQKFHKNCGSRLFLHKEECINRKLLIDDLLFLDSNRFNLDTIGDIPRVLLLHGVKDKIVPVQRSRDIAAKLKNATLVEVENAGHGLPLTHPKMCWDLISETLTDSGYAILGVLN